jgi:hypothetical protein
MSETVIEHIRDAHDLRNYLAEWIRQNEPSRDVEHRWLAKYAADLMTQAYNVKAGNHETIKTMVSAFRLQEINYARDHLAKEDAKLEAEASKLQVSV